MLFSFMGETHGRFSLAHFDGMKLVVRRSKLYRFLLEDEDSLLLFARYLGSDVNPLADTTSFPNAPRRGMVQYF